MSEDDRAAKAARAKALLNKKRQQQKKAAGTPANNATDSPSSPVISPPASRSFTPQPSESPVPSETRVSPPTGFEPEYRDPASLFGDSKDDNWLSTLPRVESTPAPTKPDTTPPLAQAPSYSNSQSPTSVNGAASQPPRDDGALKALHAERESLLAEVDRLNGLLSNLRSTESNLVKQQEHSRLLESQIQQLRSEKDAAFSTGESQQQTISFLVSEKASLTAELERLSDVEQNARETASLLEHQKAQSEALVARVGQLTDEVREASRSVEEHQAKEKELSDRYREQERELQLANGTIKQLESESAQHLQRVRDLEERIQSDDRVERLEESLQNTRDRADELELKLTKLKQTHQHLKTDYDGLSLQLQTTRDAEASARLQITDMETQQTNLLSQIAAAVAEKDTLVHDKAGLQTQIHSHEGRIKELREKLDAATSELSSASRQLNAAQTDARNAIRRAEDAERTQADLQTEGTNLMRSLDEMRPKIVELTGVKLELGEKLEALERAIKNRDVTIGELESEVDDLREQKEDAARKLNIALASREKDETQSQDRLTELQKAYSELQTELESAMASVRSLELERGGNHQEATRRLEEISNLTKVSKVQAEELVALRTELEERLIEQDENQDLLDRIQNELESLRNELALRDEEIERLRQNSSPAKSDEPHALDDEMLDSLRQQHALELSAAQSTVRALEESVFEAQSRAHALQKQVGALEEQLATQARSASRSSIPRPFSPSNGVPSRPSSRGGHTHRPTSSLSAPPITRSVFEQHLSPEMLHKRKVSLSMLKARIESEMAANLTPPSRPMSPALGGLPPIQEPDHPHLGHARSNSQHSHFIDESHVFWCHACTGDLVVL